MQAMTLKRVMAEGISVTIKSPLQRWRRLNISSYLAVLAHSSGGRYFCYHNRIPLDNY